MCTPCGMNKNWVGERGGVYNCVWVVPNAIVFYICSRSAQWTIVYMVYIYGIVPICRCEFQLCVWFARLANICLLLPFRCNLVGFFYELELAVSALMNTLRPKKKHRERDWGEGDTELERKSLSLESILKSLWQWFESCLSLSLSPGRI